MAYRPIALKKYSFRALSLFPTFVFLSTLLHLVGWNVRLNWLLERLRLQILHRTAPPVHSGICNSELPVSSVARLSIRQKSFLLAC